jgi:MoxR-like ATPase
MTENSTPSFNPSDALRVLSEKIKIETLAFQQLKTEISKVIVGQQHMIDRLLIALLADGHVLMEGVPGLAKTLAIKTLAEAIAVDFSRIQFTPDLLPADVTGTLIYNQKSEQFTVKKGPVFANFVLADEINRAPAKVQSALLEAMQERQVTIGEETFKLPVPFLVLATQNPIDQEGTYPLPEAQVDRFMLKINLGYPTKEEERLIIRSNVQENGLPACQQVITAEAIIQARSFVRQIYLDEKVEQYIVDLVFATRNPSDYGLGYLEPMIAFGCSPRASINLALAAKAVAFMEGRAFVIPEDVRAVANDVMNHRLGLSYEAEAENLTAKDIVAKIVAKVAIP